MRKQFRDILCFKCMKQSETNLSSKIPKKYCCEICDYTTCNFKDYKKHLLTRKHKMKQNETDLTPKIPKYICDVCEIKFNSRSTLWRHKKKCTSPQCVSIETEDKNKLIRLLIDKLSESGNNLNNSLNNNFNINMFLNEQCKDAINMSDFIKTLQVSADEIRRLGSMGQTEGMANIMISNLNKLDMFKRPMHCSDIQNETIYIKDQDKWEIEGIDKPKLKEALDKVSEKSIEFIPELTQDKNFVNTLNEVTKQPREDKKIISKIATSIPIEG